MGAVLIPVSLVIVVEFFVVVKVVAVGVVMGIER